MASVSVGNNRRRRRRILDRRPKRRINDRISLLGALWLTLLISFLHTTRNTCWALVSRPNHPPQKSPPPVIIANTNPVADRYVWHWDHLLLEEYRETVQQLRDRRSKWSPQRLEDYGLAIAEAFAEPESEILGEKTVRIVAAGAASSVFSSKSRRPWKDVFGKGDILEMTSLGSEATSSFSRKRQQKMTMISPRECLIMEVGDDWMVVGVGPTWPRGLWETRKHPRGYMVRLDRQMGPTAPLQAQREALQKLRSSSSLSNGLSSTSRSVGPVARLLSKLWLLQTNSTYAVTATANATIFNESFCEAEQLAAEAPLYLRKMFCQESQVDSAAAILSQHLRDALDRAIERHETFVINQQDRNVSWTANESQQSAILWALQRKIALIRGPPGTGKTKTAALLIDTALELEKERTRQGKKQNRKTKDQSLTPNPIPPIRVLAVTHSNGAADVLLEALLDMGIPAVRAGRPASMSPQVQHRSVIALAEKLPHIKQMRQELLQQSVKANSFSSGSSSNNGAGMQWQLNKALEDAQSMLLQSAPVVVTSCIGAHQLAELQTENACLFPLVVLDEAAQCTEPALVCALTAAQAQQVVLVGDTQQLPPTVTSSSQHLRQQLGVSPMERLEKAGVEQHTLRVQYRMPAALLHHPSKYFYNGLVESANGAETKSLPPRGFPWPVPDQPLAFVQVGSGDLELVHTMGGRSNPTEAKLVAAVVSDLLKEGDVAATNIAILTPYSKQVQAIRSALEERSMRVDTVVSVSSLSSFQQPSQSLAIRNVQVGTIDSFQGQETEVVIFSAVRSNASSELGFLRDRRRLCVAITRARKGLIVLGDSTVLNTCRHWQELIQSCRDRGCVISAASLKNDAQETKKIGDDFDANTDREKLWNDTALAPPILGTKESTLYGLFSVFNSTDIASLL